MTAISRRPILARLAVLAVSAVGVCWSSFDLFAQSKSELRTWQDESGKFTVVATLVSSDAISVRLRKENGAELTVPLARLSDADRKYLASLAKRLDAAASSAQEKPKRVESASTDVLDGLVHVTYPHTGVEPRLRGLVIHRDAERAHVVLLDYPAILFKQREYYESKGQKPKLTIVWGFTGKERRVEAELFETPQNISAVGGVTWILSAPASEMPGPLDLRVPLNVKRGDELQLIGVTRDDKDQWTRDIKKAVVLTVREGEGRQPASLNIAPFMGDVVAAADGKGLAFQPVTGDVGGRLVATPDGKVLAFTLPQWNYDAVGGAVSMVAGLSKIVAPRLYYMHFAPQERSGKLQNVFVLQVEDRYSELAKPLLFVQPKSGRERTSPLPSSGVLPDATELTLTKGQPDKDLTSLLEGFVESPTRSTYLAVHSSDTPEPPHTYTMQFAYETVDGRKVFDQFWTRDYKPPEAPKK